jgi:integrase
MSVEELIKKLKEKEKRAVSRDVFYGIKDKEGKRLIGFVGYEKLLEIASEIKKLKNSDELLGVYSCLFLTGCRISEVLSLKKFNIILQKNEIIFHRLPILKRYEKIGEIIEKKKYNELPKNRELLKLYKFDEGAGMYFRRKYKTRKIEVFRRDFSIPIEEPLVNLFLNWLKKINFEEMDNEKYIFPAPYYKNIGEIPLSRYAVYKQFRKIIIGYDDEGKEIWLYPHFLRSQRVCCLLTFYGLKLEEIKEILGWKKFETIEAYATFGITRLKIEGRSFPSEAKKMELQLL